MLGGSSSSRLILDLREAKSWAYYAGSQVKVVKQTMPLFVYAPVQTDKTGPAMLAAMADIKGFLGQSGITADELQRTVNSQVLSLSGSFETSAALLGGIMRIVQYGRPDDYYTRLPARYRAFTTAELDKAARGAIDPARMTWVIVGDAKAVAPQLAAAHLTAETMTAQ